MNYLFFVELLNKLKLQKKIKKETATQKVASIIMYVFPFFALQCHLQ